MKTNKRNTNICPKCGTPYLERPALSRADNKTCICMKCGTREALEIVGASEEEIRQILEKIYGDAD